MDLKEKKCVPCEGGIPTLADEKEEELLTQIPTWELVRDGVHKLQKEIIFDDFKQAMQFINQVANIAEGENHHPNISVSYNRVNLEIYTHAINGLSENDFILAAKIDEIMV